MARLPMKAPSSTITGCAPRRLEHAAEPDAAGEVHALADLGAGADRGPGVHHRARADASADVDVARHHDRARLEERAVAHRPRRHHPHARPSRGPSSGELVVELEGPDLPDLHLGDGEVEEHRLLHPGVHRPARRALLGDPQRARRRARRSPSAPPRGGRLRPSSAGRRTRRVTAVHQSGWVKSPPACRPAAECRGR